MIQFIPCNINIDKLLATNPPSHIKNFSKDKLVHIINLISAIPATNKNIVTSDGYAPLHSQILKGVVYNYRHYLTYLEEAKIIECDNWYKIGSKSKGYRLCKGYQKGLRGVTIKDHCLLKKIKRQIVLSVPFKRDYYHLIKWFTEDLCIDYDSAIQHITKKRDDKLQNKEFWDVDIHSGKLKHPHTQFAASFINIERMAHGEFLLNVDDNVRRFHSNITNMASDLRNFLTYKGEQLVSIDIVNSQPYLSTLLLNSDFWNSTLLDTVNITTINTDLTKTLNASYTTSFIKYLKDAKGTVNSDIEEYIKIVTSGRFYEFFSEELKKQLNVPDISRKQMKAVMFQVLFTANQYIGQTDATPKRLFKSMFPNVYGLLSAIKKKDKTLLPRLLQNIESELILRKITKRISLEHPLLPIFTIHDSIVTVAKQSAYVKSVMEADLFKAIGYRPMLKEQPWNLAALGLVEDISVNKYHNPNVILGQRQVA